MKRFFDLKKLTHEKKIAFNTMYQVVGKVIMSGFGVISYGLLAHYFTVSQTGEYNLIVSFTGFLVVFADFGLGTLLIRELASNRQHKEYISLVFSLRLLLSVLVLVIGAFVLFFLKFPEVVKIGIIIYSIANVFYLLSSVIWAVFQSKLQYVSVVIPQIITSATTTICVILAVLLKFSFIPTIIFASIGYVGGFIASVLFYKKSILLQINKRMFLEILQEVWPIGFGAITSVFYFKIDSLILPYYYNPATHPDLGYYATAYKLFEVALVFGGFYTNTLFPFLSAQLSRKNFLTICRKFFLYTCGIAFLASIILFVFARLFIYVLGGVKYFPAIPSLEILSLGAFVSILSGFFLSLAVAGRKQVLVLYFSIAAAILNILLNLVFIPKFSFIGASWTTVVTQAFILITNAIAALLVVRQAQSGKIRPHV